jgi:exopolyphosphatase / guanosine-5'-triphosphate,3'-diphosphate pyrophosphatase
MRFASIDIGSNAVRLLLCHVIETGPEPIFKKAELVRMPIRLGEDAFRYGKITAEKETQLVKVMQAYKLLIDAFGAIDFHACATAAMREAANSEQVINKVKKESGIEIELIDGRTEAFIIYSNHIAEHLDHSQSYLYIDVGGGSTEVTLFSDNKVTASQSFNIGTIRMLENQVTKETWNHFKNWIREKSEGHHPLTGIGSGGNINKIFKMLVRKENKPLTYEKIKELYTTLQNTTYEDRIAILGLNPDRADVIVPATKIFLTVMKCAEINDIIVPQIGLSDGIIHQLYEKHLDTIAKK